MTSCWTTVWEWWGCGPMRRAASAAFGCSSPFLQTVSFFLLTLHWTSDIFLHLKLPFCGVCGCDRANTVLWQHPPVVSLPYCRFFMSVKFSWWKMHSIAWCITIIKKMLRFNDRPVVTKHDFDQEWKETERFPGCWYTCVCVSAPCSSNAFFCHSNMCINTSLVCNGIQNCVFPWDESNCKGTPLVPKRCVTLSLKTLCAVTTMSCVVWCNMMHVTSGLLCHIEPPWGKFERYFCDRTLSQSFNFDPVTMVL